MNLDTLDARTTSVTIQPVVLSDRQLLEEILLKVTKLEEAVEGLNTDTTTIQDQLDELSESVKNLSSEGTGFGIEDLA